MWPRHQNSFPSPLSPLPWVKTICQVPSQSQACVMFRKHQSPTSGLPGRQAMDVPSSVLRRLIAKATALRGRVDARILRVGQVVGDKHGCIWNPNENIPNILYAVIPHCEQCFSIHWTFQLLPASEDAGLSFRSVSPVEWVDLLRESLKANSDDEESRENPSMKLSDLLGETMWAQRW